MLLNEQRKFPRPVYKDLHSPKWVRNKEEEDKHIRDGWVTWENRRSLPPQRFPMTIYRQDGEPVLIGKYDGNGVVHLDQAERELENYLAQGYSEIKPELPKKAQVRVIPDERPTTAPTRLDFLEDEQAVMREDIASIRANIDHLIQALSEGKDKARKPGRPRKETAEA